MAVRDVVQAAAGVGGGGEYVEDVFSTYLYTGNSSTQTINNGIDLDGEGGLVWIKSRGAIDHRLVDSARTPFNTLSSNSSGAEAASGLSEVSSFNSNGFTVESSFGTNNSSYTYASWTFRKAPKFFDVVTWTGNSTARTIAHSLGSVPGMIIVKRTDSAANWAVYHRSLTSANHSLLLNLTGAQDETGYFANTTPTDTVFSISSNSVVNASGGTYVAYLFAHDAGGFGDDGEQNVISCGSYTGTGAVGNEVTLGFEPQWLLVKSSSLGENWWLVDVMRGMPVKDYTGAKGLRPNTNSAEATPFGLYPTATGFVLADGGGAINENNAKYIYIAIRRPMKTPESGTEVFAIDVLSSENFAVAGFPVDLSIDNGRTGASNFVNDRLRGSGVYMATNSTSSETTGGSRSFDDNTGVKHISFTGVNWMFRRAPSFMDVVAYTTTTGNFTVPHNLNVAPELMILKSRDNAFGWYVYHASRGPTKTLQLHTSGAELDFGGYWQSTSPDADNLYLSGQGGAYDYIAYLFATLPGVSKVGSYTGTGADLNVDCGFSAGARFVLIKRTDSTGDWYVWDSARGIVSGNDPYLLLNSTAAEVTSTDYIDPLASGFTVTSSAPAALNASGGSYIFLAIA